MICLTHKDMVLDRLLDPKEQASNSMLNEKISYYYYNYKNHKNCTHIKFLKYILFSVYIKHI